MTKNRLVGVAVSPAAAYGSWKWLEEVVAGSNGDITWTVIAYGTRPATLPEDVRMITLPGGNYLKAGRFMSKSGWRWLNFLYLLPLSIIATTVAVRLRADVVLGNGIAATILLTPCRWLVGSRVILAYHSYMDSLRPFQRHGLSLALEFCESAVANSEGSAQNIRQIMGSKNVSFVDHWADWEFFSGTPEQFPEGCSGHVRVAYVGRTDDEKFAQCRRVCQKLGRAGVLTLRVAGAIPPGSEEDAPGIEYIGYLREVESLHKLYRWADVTWAPADVDYLSRPGVEALASGCPVLVSDIPAVQAKDDGTIRIPRSLVPPGAGWVVDGISDGEAIALLREMASGCDDRIDRGFCREIAEVRHSPRNVQQVLRVLAGNCRVNL